MYYENGQLQEKGTFAAGEPDGPYEAYDETGQLTTKGTCKEGFRVGKWIEDGKSKSYLFDQYDEVGSETWVWSVYCWYPVYCPVHLVDRVLALLGIPRLAVNSVSQLIFSPCPPGLEDGN